MAKKKPTDESPYEVIAKVGTLPPQVDPASGKNVFKAKCVTLKTRNLISTFNYLKRTYPKFTWMNVFDRESKLQVANFTINNPPTTQKLKK